ncbi:MAG: phosphotransferase [Caldilineaceae bacterium]
MTNEEQKFAQLVQILAPQRKLLQVWSLTGGISATMTAFTFATAAGQTRKMIVRRPSPSTLQRNPQAAQDEFRLLQLAHRLGLATPTPYYVDSSGQLFDTPYLVIEYIEGKPEFTPVDVADYVLQAATQLAQIHSVDSTKVDLTFLPQQVASLSKHPPTLHVTLAEGQIRKRLEEVWPLASRNAPVLLHGDFWPGNILWQAGKLVAVIDWEDATVGDPLLDLAISRLDMVCIFGVEAMQAFTQHYQARRDIDYTQLPDWDLYAALRFIRLAGDDLAAWAAFYPPFGRPDITEQTLRAHYQFFVAQAFEQLATR